MPVKEQILILPEVRFKKETFINIVYLILTDNSVKSLGTLIHMALGSMPKNDLC